MAISARESFAQTDYYYDPPGSLTNVNNWGDNPDGSGNPPPDFTSADQIFNITESSVTLDAAWTVSGTGSKVVVGDGIGSTTLTLPEDYTITGTVDVSNGSTLEVTNNTAPTMGTLGTTSTVIYNENVGASNQVVAAGSYGDLILRQASPSKEIDTDITVRGDFQMESDAALAVEQDATLTLEGDFILTGAVSFTADVKDHLTITTAATGGQTFTASSSTGTIPCQNLTSTKTSGFLTLAASPATSLDIGNNLTISYVAGASFNDNGNSITVGGTFTVGSDGDKNIPEGTYENLTVNLSTGNGILQGGVTVNGTLTLTNGSVELGNNDLTIGSGGSIASATSSKYIITNGSGVLIRSTVRFSGVIFPIGTFISYTPCTITRNSSTDVSFAIRSFDGVLNNGTSGDEVAQIQDLVDRTWVIDPTTTPAGLNVNLLLQWNESDEGLTFDRSMVRVFKYDTEWVQVVEDTPAGSDPFDVFVVGITSFSEFSVGDAGSTLPVTWLSFAGEEVTPGIASLEWKTASELNNKGFEVQKSLDGKNYEPMGFVDGAGTTNEIQTYGFADEQLRQNTYYRLKQIDFDGQFDYSRIVFVQSSQHIAHPFSVYPNPVGNNTDVQLVYQLAESDKKQPLQLELHDMHGRLLLSVNGNINELNELLNTRISHIPQGVYLLTLTDFATRTHLKMLKQ